MFWSKNKKIGIVPLHTPVLLNKSGVQGGIDYMDMLPDEICFILFSNTYPLQARFHLDMTPMSRDQLAKCYLTIAYYCQTFWLSGLE